MAKSKYLSILVAAAIAVAGPVSAASRIDEAKTFEETSQNLADVYSLCAAYYSVAIETMDARKIRDDELRDSLRVLGVTAYDLAEVYNKGASNSPIKLNKAIIAKKQNLIAELKDADGNFVVLFENYSDNCSKIITGYKEVFDSFLGPYRNK